MSEHQPSRRGLLAGAAAVALLGPATAAHAADPLVALVADYRAECEQLNATVGDIAGIASGCTGERLRERCAPWKGSRLRTAA